jgi:predicted transcriptional regulator
MLDPKLTIEEVVKSYGVPYSDLEDFLDSYKKEVIDTTGLGYDNFIEDEEDAPMSGVYKIDPDGKLRLDDLSRMASRYFEFSKKL